MTMQQTIVVKIGSSSLTTAEGSLNYRQIHFYAGELARLHHEGHSLLLVTSGAIAAGFKAIGYHHKPKQLHEKQAAAAVGQALLMQAYNEAFSSHRIAVAQMLLTRDDFSNRDRGLNAYRTMKELLTHRVVPIINENDSVAVDELKFSENDTLSALVANLIKAGQLIIITDTDGLYTSDPHKNPEATRINHIEELTDELYHMAGGAGSSVGTGGMRSKLDAAKIAMRGGIQVFIGRVTESGDLLKTMNNNGKGTYLHPGEHYLSLKKQWVGFHSKHKGTIYIDQGAEKALMSGGKSLLPVGVTHIVGEFFPGDIVEVSNMQQHVIGRGVVNYASWQLQAACGLSSDEVIKHVNVQRVEVIHRDDWIHI